MEHIIVSQMMKHLESKSILSEVQFGFRACHSCEAQLLLTINDLTKAIDNKLQVDMAILDFSKAFDKVSHSRLIQKLDFYGIRGTLLNWIKSFLSNHSQQVVVSGEYSAPSLVTSGVPQGSVFGPVLFLLYINDIETHVGSQMRLFADDHLIYHTIQDHLLLQDDPNTLTAWADLWLMHSKCKFHYVVTVFISIK